MSFKIGHRVRGWAPASVGNAAVGFDILGFSLESFGDEVEIKITAESGQRIEIGEISGLASELPRDIARNTATVAVRSLLQKHPVPYSVQVSIHKNIPLSSGLGGSAASAVAAAVAANQLLSKPLDQKDLLPFVLDGEEVASGARHADNVGPSLLGGLCLDAGGELVAIPVPKEIHAVVVHPNLQLETKKARGVLSSTVPLNTVTRQSTHLAAFLSGCFLGRTDLIRQHLHDIMIEPQRAHLIPGFLLAKETALSQGALGFSISGAGPSVFAWTDSYPRAVRTRDAIVGVFASLDLQPQAWISPIAGTGARVMGVS